MKLIAVLGLATLAAMISAVAFSLVASGVAVQQSKASGTPPPDVAVAFGLVTAATIMAFATLLTNLPAAIAGLLAGRFVAWSLVPIVGGLVAILIMRALVTGRSDEWVPGMFGDLPRWAPLGFSVANGVLLAGALSLVKFGQR